MVRPPPRSTRPYTPFPSTTLFRSEPAALAAAADAGAGLAQAVAADAFTHAGRERAVVAAGEDLDHAADRFRTIEARARAAHDLDAVDLVDRQVLERRQPGADRAHAHAVDQHQHLVGFGAAQEHVAQLAVAALVADVDAGDRKGTRLNSRH